MGCNVSEQSLQLHKMQRSEVNTYPEISPCEKQDMSCELTRPGKTLNLLLVFNFNVFWPLWNTTATHIVRSHNMLRRKKHNINVKKKNLVLFNLRF